MHPESLCGGHFIGGHIALDFCNTVYRRFPEVGAELLDSPETFRRWLTEVGLLSADARPVSEQVLADAVELRTALWSAFDAHRDRRPIESRVLADILADAQRGAEWVDIDERGTVTLSDPTGASAAISLIALQLLLNPPMPPVRTCDGCGWFFIDSSRGHRRRWCSMRTCGNDHKVARYRSSHTDE